MGFSLANYFLELQCLLDDTNMNAAKKLKAIRAHKDRAIAYAKQCNALPK